MSGEDEIKKALDNMQRDYEARIKEVQAQYEQIQSEHRQLRDVHEQHKRTIENTHLELVSVRNELSSSNNKIIELQHAVEQKDSDITQLTSKLADAETLIEQTKVENISMSATIDELNVVKKEKDELDQQYAELKQSSDYVISRLGHRVRQFR